MADVKFSQFPAGDRNLGGQVVGLNSVGANAQFPISDFGVENAIYDNTTYTVGVGKDFTTIDAAIAAINNKPIGAGNAATDFADTRIPRYTLQLDAGAFPATSANGYIRLEGVTAQVAIVGAGSGATTLGDAGTIFKIVNCTNVRFDDIALAGTLDMVDSHVIDGFANFDTNYSACAIVLTHESEFRGGGPITCKRLYVQLNSFATVNDVTLNNDITNQPTLRVDTGSVVSIQTLTVNALAGTTVSPISVAYGGRVDSGAGLVLTGGQGGNPAVAIETGGTMSFTTGVTNTSLFDSIANVTPGEIQANGSAFFDGVTPPTLAT